MRNLKKEQFLLSVAVRDRKHANRSPRPKVSVSQVVEANVKGTTKSLDFLINRARCKLVGDTER